MKTTMKFLTYVMMAFALVLTTASCDGEDGMDGAEGPQGEQGIPGPTRESIYTESGSLNSGSITATDTFNPVGPPLSFTKVYDDSNIEVFLNSNVSGGTFAGGTSGVRFEIRVDGNPGTLNNNGVIRTSNSSEFISIFDLFEDLGTGDHTAQIYVETNGGTSTGVLLDPGGWNGKIIVKETF